MEPTKLKKILKSALKGYNINHIIKRHKATALWEQVCGKEASSVSKARYLKGKWLYVSVKDHIWASQMTHFEMQYIEKFDKLLGPGVVAKIFFQARSQDFEKPKTKASSKKDFCPSSIKLNKEEKKNIDELIKEISDEATKMHAEKILTTAFKKRKWLLKHGGSPCFHCKTPVEKDRLFCPPCERKLETLNVANLKALLEKKPWLNYEEAVKEVFPLSKGLFLQIKESETNLIEQSINNRLYSKDPSKRDSSLKIDIITYAMMKSGNPPAKLKNEMLQKILPAGMYKFYVR